MFRCWFIGILILLCNANLLIAQHQPINWLADGQKKTFRFQHINGLIILKAKLKGKKKINFIVDTGADQSLFFKKEKIDALHLPYERSISIYGTDMRDSVEALVCRQIPIHFNKKAVVMLDMLVLKESKEAWSAMLGQEIDGILGSDFLKFYVIELNYTKSRITFYPNSTTVKHLDQYVKQSVAFIKNKPYIKAACSARTATTLDLLFDTGSSLDLIFIYKKEEMELPDHIVPSFLGFGLGGELTGFKSRVEELKIFGQKFYNMIANYQQAAALHKQFLQLDPKDGIVGGDVLSRFDFVLDYPKQTIYSRPNRSMNKAYSEDRSGLDLISVGQSHQLIFVLHAWPGSPAAEADIRKGDRIHSVSGFVFPHYDLGAMRQCLTRPGAKKVKLIIERNGVKYKKIIQLRDLI